jgi:putative ABC transport system ATP-binding protein
MNDKVINETIQPMIQTNHLSKVYRSEIELRVLDDVTLSIQPGEFVAVTGPSGSGKSTLLNLIGTLDMPSEGEVFVNGVDTKTLRGNSLADFRLEHIGFVFQAFNLIPALSVLENVMLPLIPYRDKLNFKLEDQALGLLQAVGLEKRLKHLPSQLSGGEQQRVAIARALVNTPKLVLADEPTGNLDHKAGEEIIDLLIDFNKKSNVTVLLVTHNDSLTRFADQIFRLQDGRLLGSE